MAVINASFRLSFFQLTTRNARLADISYCKWLQTKTCNSFNSIFRFYGNSSTRKRMSVGLLNSPRRYYSRRISEFPSFSTNNYEGFIASPPFKVAADIIIHGIPNKTNLPSSIITKLDQSPTQLLEGSLLAIEAVTEMIQDSVTLNKDKDLDIAQIKTQYSIEMKDLLTVNCQESLAEYCYSMITNSSNKDTRKDMQLVYTPKDDIFFAWIEELKGMLDGTVEMTVCTLSFPNYGWMIHNVQENVKSQKIFVDYIAKEATNLQKEDVQKKIEEHAKSLFDPTEHIKSNEIVASNFTFKHGPCQEDTWLIDNISTKIGTKAFSKIALFRWRGRMVYSIRGYKMKNILRLDYASDYVILMLLLFSMQIVVVGF